MNNDLLHSLTDTRRDASTPHLAVLAGCSFLALQTVSRGAEELAARVEVGAVRTLVAAVDRHVELWTADFCHRKHSDVMECSMRVHSFAQFALLHSAQMCAVS